jgi:DNA-binding transcriptional LysR family regulator
LSIREAIDRALTGAHTEVNVALEFDNIETMKRAIDINAGVSILPEPSVRREIALGSLAKAAIAGDALVRPLGIVCRRDRTMSELAMQFIGLLKADSEFCEELTTANGSVAEAAPSVRSA